MNTLTIWFIDFVLASMLFSFMAGFTVDDYVVSYLYTQCLHSFPDIEPFEYVFGSTGFGVFDAECLLEFLFC